MKNYTIKYKNRIALKSLIAYIILISVFAVTVCLIGYGWIKRAMLRQYEMGGFRIAAAAQFYIDPDKLDEYLEIEGGSEEYQAMWSNLDQLCNASEATFIYVIQPDRTDYGHVTYIFSTVNHNSQYTPYNVGFVKETTNEEYREKYRSMMEGKTDRESLVLEGRDYATTTHHITIMTSLKGKDGKTKGLLCVQRQMKAISIVRQEYVKDVIQATLLLALISTLINTFFQRKTLLNPLGIITTEAIRFAKENALSGQKLTDVIRNNDEIGQLAASIDSMEEQVVQYVDDLTKFTAEQERVSTELSLAARIQEDMLPNSFPAFPDRQEFDIYASMDPAREVGGDFYDFFMIDDDHLCVEIADVSGKGIPAALFMMSSKIILEDHAKTTISPAEILEKANNAICKNDLEKMFVTVWLGILEISTGRLIAANAGHEYPAIKKPDGNYELLKDKHGFVLGGMEDMKYKNYEIMLEPGSRIFVYTDGVPEATDAEEAMFGTDRMIEALNEQPEASPREAMASVRKAVDAFVKDTEQFDDLTMLCLEYKGPVQEDNNL